MASNGEILLYFNSHACVAGINPKITCPWRRSSPVSSSDPSIMDMTISAPATKTAHLKRGNVPSALPSFAVSSLGSESQEKAFQNSSTGGLHTKQLPKHHVQSVPFIIIHGVRSYLNTSRSQGETK